MMTAGFETTALPTTTDVIGSGPDALLLPALSSISTRREMQDLAHYLERRLRCVTPDWPGFGGEPRARSDLSPESMRRFLDALLEEGMRGPLVGIGAGHGASYLAEASRSHPGRFTSLVLIAPTWRGPLPTMFGGRRQGLCRAVRTALGSPILGPALYALNVSRPVVDTMMRAHVYADRSHVTDTVLKAKLAVAQQRGARFSTAAFVTGALDPCRSRAAFLALFDGDLPPTLLIRPADAPPRSAAEIEALAATGRVTVARVPGALAPHEEFPQEVGSAVLDFLDGLTGRGVTSREN